jgi:hypothetical protein
MGCDWQNRAEAARNYSECSSFPASNSDRIERGARRRTSDTRDALSRFAMMMSMQRTSSVPGPSYHDLDGARLFSNRRYCRACWRIPERERYGRGKHIRHGENAGLLLVG